jgi:hypothetical protein
MAAGTEDAFDGELFGFFFYGSFGHGRRSVHLAQTETYSITAPSSNLQTKKADRKDLLARRLFENARPVREVI